VQAAKPIRRGDAEHKLIDRAGDQLFRCRTMAVVMMGVVTHLLELLG